MDTWGGWGSPVLPKLFAFAGEISSWCWTKAARQRWQIRAESDSCCCAILTCIWSLSLPGSRSCALNWWERERWSHRKGIFGCIFNWLDALVQERAGTWCQPSWSISRRLLDARSAMVWAAQPCLIMQAPWCGNSLFQFSFAKGCSWRCSKLGWGSNTCAFGEDTHLIIAGNHSLLLWSAEGCRLLSPP